MGKKIFAVGIMVVGVVVSGAIVNGARAQTSVTARSDSLVSIQYPVAALGNCSSKEACKTYCDDASHAAACLSFAKAHNLMSESEVNVAEELARGRLRGPGGCDSLGRCQTYCSNIDHINECLAFAEKTGITPPGGLEQAKRIQAAIARGVTPPACTSKEECDTYCSEAAHMKECITFGEAAGFLKGEELRNAQKVLVAIDKGATPPPCQGGDACNAYCSASADHMRQCVAFAQAAGMMTPEDAQNSQGMIKALQAGVKPPSCRGREECNQYCADPAHVNECTKFAVAAGFMTEKDAEMAQKTGGKGPGGCIGKDACETFCNDPQNQQTCFQFGKDNGLIPPEEVRKMEQGQRQTRQALERVPPDVLNCLQSAVGSDVLDKLKSGQVMGNQDIGTKMQECFQSMHPSEQGGRQGGERSGPQGQFPSNASGTFPGNDPMMRGQNGPRRQNGEQGDFRNGGQMPPFEHGQFQGRAGQLPMMQGDNQRGNNGRGDEGDQQQMMRQFQTQFQQEGNLPDHGQFPPNRAQPFQGQALPNGQFPPNGMPPSGQMPPTGQMSPTGQQPMQQPPSGTATPPPPSDQTPPPPPSSGNVSNAFNLFINSLLNIGK